MMPCGGPAQLRVDLRTVGDHQLTALRLLVLADVLRRIAENRTSSPVTTLVLGGSTLTGRLRPVLSRLGIPELRSAAPDDHVPAGTTTVIFRPGGGGRDAVDNPCAYPVGAVVPAQFDALNHQLDGRDPLVLRLALLRAPWPTPVTLSSARMHRAEETLNRWRFKVAGWKDAPVAPPYGLAELHTVLTENLDTATALRLMHRLESDVRLASGAKFATFTDIDRILGLDLRRPVLPWG